LQGVGAAILGWVVFNIGCWMAHAYLDREFTFAAPGIVVFPVVYSLRMALACDMMLDSGTNS